VKKSRGSSFVLIWGKLAGAIFGYMLGGWIGMFIGILLGNYLDRGIRHSAYFDYSPGNQAEIQNTFFTTVFSVMGHLAKADGRVSESEITMARNIMSQMQLDSEQEKAAIDLFTKGKTADFPLDQTIDNFHRTCHHNRNLERMFIEILLFAAYADGVMHDAERSILVRICSRMGISEFEYRRLEKMVHAQQAFHERSGAGTSYTPSRDMLEEAYDALGIDKTATDAEVKKAYRRQINQHHPDKLVAKGLPEEMIKLANEKTHEINVAYDTICKARGIR
jgi:DnaJ like chaperone protein